MAGPSRTLKLTYLGDASQLKKTNKELDQDYNKLGDRFKKFGVRAAKAFAVAGAAAVVMAGKFTKDAITSASDLTESINALEVTFSDASKGMLDLSSNAARAVGLASSEFNTLAVGFAGFTKQIADGEQDVVDVTQNLTTRVADFASVMNLEVPEAAAVFKSTLAGSSEVMRNFGIDTSAAAVTQFALESGLIATKDEMNENIRVQATYDLVMQETEQMAGDFANTSDQLANSQRILAAEFENAKAEAGEELLPIMQTLVGFIREEVIPRFGDFIERIVDLIARVQEFWQTHGPKIIDSFNRVKNAGIGIRDVVAEIIGNFSSLFDEFDDNTKEGSSIFTFANFLEGLTIFMEVLGQSIERLLSPLRQLSDLIDRIINNRVVKGLQDLTQSVYGTLGIGPRGQPSRGTGPLTGLQGPAQINPLIPPVQGPNRAMINNITINGPTDSEGAARAVQRILDDSARRSGPTQRLVFTP